MIIIKQGLTFIAIERFGRKEPLLFGAVSRQDVIRKVVECAAYWPKNPTKQRARLSTRTG